jgi:hypothetical protein
VQIVDDKEDRITLGQRDDSMEHGEEELQLVLVALTSGVVGMRFDRYLPRSSSGGLSIPSPPLSGEASGTRTRGESPMRENFFTSA